MIRPITFKADWEILGILSGIKTAHIIPRLRKLKAGDILYVKEDFNIVHLNTEGNWEILNVMNKKTGDWPGPWALSYRLTPEPWFFKEWVPARRMLPWFSRIRLLVESDETVKRVNITDDMAKECGIRFSENSCMTCYRGMFVDKLLTHLHNCYKYDKQEQFQMIKFKVIL